MAERERFVYTARAVRRGVLRGLVAWVIGFGLLGALGFFVSPILRDLFGVRSTPGPVAYGLVAAVVAVVVGYAHMRASRSVRAEGSADDLGRSGSRALGIARAERARLAARQADGGVPVQRWSHDLLSGADRVPGEAVS